MAAADQVKAIVHTSDGLVYWLVYASNNRAPSGLRLHGADVRELGPGAPT